MNAPRAGMSGEMDRGQFWPWAIAALAVGFFAINSESFWIDEALTGLKARQPDLASWWRMMADEKGSDLQMPLYMFYIWGFAKIFGTTEWALRAANVPWFVCGVATFVCAFPRRQRWVSALVTLVCPFAWYYLNEARPYAMQLGAGLMVVAALYQFNSDSGDSSITRSRWVWIFVVGIVALSGSSLLGMIWAAAAMAALPVILSRQRLSRLAATHLPASFVAGALLLAIGSYYAWTLKVGARASPVGTTDFQTVGFVGYELLGFSGLGPGRLEIREAGLRSLAPFVIPLACYTLGVAVILCGGVMEVFRRSSMTRVAGLSAAVMAPVVLVLGAGVILHFRVLGRHFMPVLPVILLMFELGFLACLSKRPWRFAVAVFFLLGMASCLELRFAARHEKDNYRGAAGLAASALAGRGVVWWNASREGAAYYHLPLASDTGKPGQAVLLTNPTSETLGRMPAPDVVITSKRDVYDDSGAVAEYLRKGSYSQSPVVCRAFSVWENKK